MKLAYDILVPTCKPYEKVKELVARIMETSDTTAGNLHVTCKNVSASINRNYALQHATAPVVIMLDDDISGFYPGWDETLVEALHLSSNHVMVSARLMNKDNTPGTMMNITPNLTGEFQYVNGFLPSACIAFYNDGTRFDENFIGSGWEDTDFCVSLQKKYPKGEFLIANEAKLIHNNEMKNGNGIMFAKNKAYYLKKHGVIV